MAGLLGGGFLLYNGIRRIRRALQPGQDQEEFADTLQIANDEDEAHVLLQRYLERILAPKTTAVVLNSNNSADRLEAVVPLPAGSALAQTLRGAQPRSCHGGAVRPDAPRGQQPSWACCRARCAPRARAPPPASRWWWGAR